MAFIGDFMSSKREKISGARVVASDYQSEKPINMHGPSVEQPQITASLVGHSARRAFLGSCVAHVLHDGYTDLIYVMLPIWQTQFGIGYAWLAVIRALYLGSPAGFQVPANRLAKRFGDKTILVSGTALAAIGYGLAGLSGSILGLGVALSVAGVGSILDTGVRMGLLIFLPFILKAKGASLPAIGVALALVFMGGASGKFICGWLGARMGVLWSITLTEAGTAAAIILLLFFPMLATWILLPLLGALINGTSSVLYGTVPEVASPGQTEHAFALFYTGVIGSGALFPIAFGLLGDFVGINWATLATAASALAIVPLAFALASELKLKQPS
jgi:MFS family permease